MEEMKDKINSKFFEIGALIFLKNKGFINEQEFIKIKREIEKEYFIEVRLDFVNYD